MQDFSQVEKDLWEAADQLRANSNLASSEYFMPLLGVIFLRHATNRFDAVTKEIAEDQAAGCMPKRKPIRADYVRRRALWLPENTRFDQSNNVTIKNYKIFGGKDGINPVSSSNVKISDVYIFAVDDCIATKAHGGGGSYENVHVENATLLCYRYGGIKIGTETKAEYIRNITFRNIEIIRAARPAIIQVRDGARVSNVVMENIIVDHAGQAAIDFVIGDSRKLRGHIDGVTVRNFVVHSRSKGERIRLAGYSDEFMIRNVTFEGLVIEGKPILKLEDIPKLEERHTKDITFRPAP